MARRTKSYSTHADPRTGNVIVRFTHEGRRYGISTRETDPRRAEAAAKRIYLDVISGRGPVGPKLDDVPFDLIAAKWLAAMESELPASLPTLEMYVRAHWLPHFDRVTPASVGEYMRKRLRSVTAETVRKELVSLRRLCLFAHEQGLMSPVLFPPLPGKALGTRMYERVRVDLTAAQVEAILAAMPETIRGRRGRVFPLRAFYTVMWETGLRRGTLRRLETPKHYRKGSSELFISADIDKARYERTIPLSSRADELLRAHAQGAGLIFGAHDCRAVLRSAGLRAGLPASLAARLSDHDFRHARTTHLLEAGGDLMGVGYLVGHTQATTTNLYCHARRAAAERVLQVTESVTNKS